MRAAVAVTVALAAAFAVAVVATAAPKALTFVFCAPGSPGSTDEAKPAMDAFAAALGDKAGVAIAATYEPTEDGGVARLRETGIGVVSLPFFLKHDKELGLHPRLGVIQKGRPALDKWVLVAQKGHAKTAESFDGYAIVSSAAFAPAFVRGAVAGEIGVLPASVKPTQAGAVMSSLRKAADGDKVAVLLDGTQAAALDTLPFAAKLDAIARSPAVPLAIVVTIDKVVTDKDWVGIQTALLGLKSTALDTITIDHFIPLDDAALGAARDFYARVK